MSEEKKSIFAKGLYVKSKFVGQKKLIELSIKVSDFIEFMNAHTNEAGYVNVNLWENDKEDAKFSHNAVLNDWKPDPSKKNTSAPTPQQSTPTASTKQVVEDDLPF